MHKMASDIIDIRKDMHGLSTQMKEIIDILQNNQHEASRNKHDYIAPSQAQNRKEGIGLSLIEQETRLTWASNCDSDMNFEREREGKE
jgi:Tfp pilus assembly protein PilZ